MDPWVRVLLWLLLVAAVILLAWGAGWFASRRVIGGDNQTPSPGSELALGGVLGGLVLGGGRRHKKKGNAVPHIYNRRWDQSSHFSMTNPEGVGPDGKPLVIVPYRANPLQNRAEHLAIFVRTLRDRVPSAAVLVAEQSDDGRRFNRGQVFNAAVRALEDGKVEGMDPSDFTHYVLNDVDLIPSHGLAKFYPKVPEKGPLHLAVRNRLYEMPTMDLFFGGVVSITPEDYRAANGFPNRFWGWGGEDLVFRSRSEAISKKMFRPSTGYIVNVPHAWGEQAGHARADDLNEMVRAEDPIETDGVRQTLYTLDGTTDLNSSYDPPLPPTPPAVLATLDLKTAEDESGGKRGGGENVRSVVHGPETFPWDGEIPAKPDVYTHAPLFPPDTELLQETYRTGRVELNGGQTVKLASAISPVEGRHLYDVVKSNGFTKTLEVGFANGTSALYIAGASKKNAEDAGGVSRHVAIDPNQMSQWKGAGLEQVRKAGLSVELIKEDSTTALPKLLKDGERFQFVFVDGMHLFDYTLVDFFFGSRLLEVGGVICVDDIKHPAVRDWLRYAEKNYPHLRLDRKTLARNTLATFVKVGEDTRSWDFHRKIGGGGGEGRPPSAAPPSILENEPGVVGMPDSEPDAPEYKHGWFQPPNRAVLASLLSPKTRNIVELGSWLGKSGAYMLDRAPNARLYAVDLWSNEFILEGQGDHYAESSTQKRIIENVPLYETFLKNMWPYRDRMTPMRMQTTEGVRRLKEAGLKADLVYVDADHHYDGAKADIEAVLDAFPGAHVVGDDWDYPDVRRAAKDVAKARGLSIHVEGGKCWTYTKYRLSKKLRQLAKGPKRTKGKPVLFQAAKSAPPEKVKQLLDGGADPSKSFGPRAETPLHVAAYHGRTAVVKILLEAGADPCAENSRGETPLDSAKASFSTGATVLLEKAGCLTVRRTETKPEAVGGDGASIRK